MFDIVGRRVDEMRSLNQTLHCTAAAATAAANYVPTPTDKFLLDLFAIKPRVVTGALLMLMKLSGI